MITLTNHRETYRFVPSTSAPVSPERVAQLLKAEWELFTNQTGKSAEESKRALKSLPMGVTSSFQHWDPYPISVYPDWLEKVIMALPLWHGIELVRAFWFGEINSGVFVHIFYFVVMIGIGLFVTSRRLRALFLR